MLPTVQASLMGCLKVTALFLEQQSHYHPSLSHLSRPPPSLFFLGAVDQINTVICCIAAYPLGLLFRMIPASMPTVRHLVTGATGFGFCYLCFREQALQLVGMVVLNYMIILFGGKQRHNIALACCMLHLFSRQMYQRTYFWGDYGLDVTGPLMILCQKMSQLAFSVHDGTRKAEDLTPLQKELVLNRIPSFIEVFGYAFNFTSVLLGPNYQFNQYLDQIEVNDAPSGVVRGVTCLGLAFAYIGFNKGVAAILGVSVSPQDLVDPTSEIFEASLFSKYLHIMLSMLVYRCTVRVFDYTNLHSRMPLVPTHARLKRASV
jgi:hypothetical protein